MEKKLVIIDGNAIMHRGFHAIPDLTSKTGKPVNAVYGLVSMLLRIINDLKPTHLTVCFDEKEKTFRHIEFPQYQSQRPVTHKDLSSQFEIAREFLKTAYIPVFSKPGFEADDVIGTIAQKVSKTKKVKSTFIVTGDKDILQLVDDGEKISLYMPTFGLSSAKIFQEAEVVEKLGVRAEQIPDYKALVGDPSDNYKGVTGIGPKTAVRLLGEYVDIARIYGNIKRIDPKTSKKLIDGRDLAMQSLMLATIVKNVPVDVDFDKMAKWDIDSPKVISFFEKLGFKTLTARVKKVGADMDVEAQASLFG